MKALIAAALIAAALATGCITNGTDRIAIGDGTMAGWDIIPGFTIPADVLAKGEAAVRGYVKVRRPELEPIIDRVFVQREADNSVLVQIVWKRTLQVVLNDGTVITGDRINYVFVDEDPEYALPDLPARKSSRYTAEKFADTFIQPSLPAPDATAPTAPPSKPDAGPSDPATGREPITSIGDALEKIGGL